MSVKNTNNIYISDITIIPKTITENGVYNAPADDAIGYNPVTVDVDTKTPYNEGFEAGKQAEYDTFWNDYQNNGNRTNYSYGFYGIGWNNITFKPKHNIKSTDCTYMFQNCNITNLKELLEKQNVILDTSKCTRFTNMFNASHCNVLPTIDMSSAMTSGLMTNVFSSCPIHTIEKLILPNPTTDFPSSFLVNSSLKNVVFEGTVQRNGFNIQWSTKLTKESITSLIGCLSDITTGLTVTLSKTAKENAFTAEEWATLIATKSNWTIALA